jgi:ATP-binding cassette subfamily C protein/competence factor transporting protein
MIGIITSKIVYKKAYQNIEYHSVFNNTLIENVNMINSIKNLNVTDISLKKVENDLSVFLNDSFLLNKFLNLTNNLKDWVNEIGFFIVNTWGFYLFFNNNLSVTQLITFNTLLSLFVNPLKNCIDSLPKYNLLKATYIKLNDFLSVDEEKNGESAELLDNSIEIKNLNYSYNSINNIINNVSFKINSGEFVSFKGPSGCGKSTICKILDRYITDYKGTILIGNENIKDKSITTIRNNIRYVSQNEALFTGTIKENILLGRTISNELFLKIVKLCDVDKIVDKKNMRYESVISDMAENLSGGEKERIILARALVTDFKILILDEALSEVDYKLEREIITNLKKYYKDKTIIYITHKNQNDLFDRIINIGGNHELSKST